ncbi:MAG TPA: protein translocase subunit SecD, partial [Gammaproteobacteria bacterium]|nr:protein translocase subunit SecD [Gammaproteobacteria bacterium]
MITNRYPLWKYLFILAVILIGAIYAAPNLYGEDPAVQVSARGGIVVDKLPVMVTEILQQVEISPMAVEEGESQVLLRFPDEDTQLKAFEQLQQKLDDEYTVALNLAPATPDWMRKIGAEPMSLGLDLRGGVYFLLQIDMNAAMKQKLEGFDNSIRTHLREKSLRYTNFPTSTQQIRVYFESAALRDTALDELASEFPDLDFSADDQGGAYSVQGVMRESVMEDERKNALAQNISTLRKRVDELGVSEPVIQQQGKDRIAVQLPGVQDTAKAKEIIGATATLEYRLVHGTYSDWAAAQSGRVPLEARLYKQRDGQPILLKRSVIVTGNNIINATTGFDQQNMPAVFVTLDGKGANRMSDISGDNIGKPMAVVFIETKYEDHEVDGKIVKQERKVEEVISVATIRDQLGKRFQTTGLDAAEARDLALLLRAGSLRAPMQFVEERTVGPSLGKENIERGFHSTWVGFAAIAVFMILYYMMFGVTSVLALGANVVLLIGLLSMLPTTLTLPGMAGIALTIGMAIDANVLIN